MRALLNASRYLVLVAVVGSLLSAVALYAYGIIDAVYTLPGDSLIAQAHDAGLTGGEGSSVADPGQAGPAPETGA